MYIFIDITHIIIKYTKNKTWNLDNTDGIILKYDFFSLILGHTQCSWLTSDSAQRSPLAGLGRPYRVLGIEPMLVACKSHILPIIISLWPLFFLLIFCFLCYIQWCSWLATSSLLGTISSAADGHWASCVNANAVFILHLWNTFSDWQIDIIPRVIFWMHCFYSSSSMS